jgi:carbamoyltransferase
VNHENCGGISNVNRQVTKGAIPFDRQKKRLGAALGLPAIEGLVRLNADLTILAALLDTHKSLWDLEDHARSDQIVAERLASLKRNIDRFNGVRHELIDNFDRTFVCQSTAQQQISYSETPGEICDRLLILDLKIESATKTQHNTSVDPEARRRCITKVQKLRKWRHHLTAVLEQMIDHIRDGRASLPPRSEFKMYNDRELNPATRSDYKPPCVAPGKFAGGNTVLGIACTGHGASIALITRDGLVRASVLDRWAVSKHTLMFAVDEARAILDRETPIDTSIYNGLVYGFGKFPPYRLFEEDFPRWQEWFLQDLDISPKAIDLVVTSESHFATRSRRLGSHLDRWFPNARAITQFEHHAVHQRQAFWASGFDEAAVVTLDTCGEDLGRLADRKVCGTISRMNRDGDCEVLREFLFPESSAGYLYALVTRHLGFRQGQEGKTMGLAPYGSPELFERIKPYLRLREDGSFEFLDGNKFSHLLSLYIPPRSVGSREELTERYWNVAYAGQALIERIVSNVFAAALRISGLDSLVYAGGVALNSVVNQVAYQFARPKALYISPNPGDSGHALGCALYGAYEVSGWNPPSDPFGDYLGPVYDKKVIRLAVQQSGFRVRNNRVRELAAKALARGEVVAHFQGGAEFGPRALGNRSILADPRDPNMRDHLNANVKFREWFRPFAPAVLEEHVSEWFDIAGPSPFMLRVVDARVGTREKIPAVVHVDGTARLQTVNSRQNSKFWRLIDLFRKETGIPLVLNTSFNLDGEPIIERPEDAIACFARARIDHLLIEDFLLSKPSKGESRA